MSLRMSQGELFQNVMPEARFLFSCVFLADLEMNKQKIK